MSSHSLPLCTGRGTLHAKFDVVNGPSVPAPATVQFLCDGATMSGLTFELSNDAYKVSLVKNKCLSGESVAINKLVWLTLSVTNLKVISHVSWWTLVVSKVTNSLDLASSSGHSQLFNVVQEKL